METTLTVSLFQRLLLRGDVDSLEASCFSDAACLAAGHIDPFLSVVPPTLGLSTDTLSVQLAHQVAGEAQTSVTFTSSFLAEVFTDLSTDPSPHRLISA